MFIHGRIVMFTLPSTIRTSDLFFMNNDVIPTLVNNRKETHYRY